MSLVFGFGGFRWHTGTISFRPMLPTRARRLEFPMQIRGSRLRVRIEADEVSYSLQGEESLELLHYDEPFTLEPDQTRTFAGEFHTRDASQ